MCLLAPLTRITIKERISRLHVRVRCAVQKRCTTLPVSFGIYFSLRVYSLRVLMCYCKSLHSCTVSKMKHEKVSQQPTVWPGAFFSQSFGENRLLTLHLCAHNISCAYNRTHILAKWTHYFIAMKKKIYTRVL